MQHVAHKSTHKNMHRRWQKSLGQMPAQCLSKNEKQNHLKDSMSGMYACMKEQSDPDLSRTICTKWALTLCRLNALTIEQRAECCGGLELGTVQGLSWAEQCQSCCEREHIEYNLKCQPGHMTVQVTTVTGITCSQMWCRTPADLQYKWQASYGLMDDARMRQHKLKSLYFTNATPHWTITMLHT